MNLMNARTDFQTVAIIPVAGLSSRMGDFKPLMEVAGEPLVRRTVRSALAGGVREARVVLGREAEAVRAALADVPQVVFVENPLYASTDMLRSVQMAMRNGNIADGQALREAILGRAQGAVECLRTRLSGDEPDAVFILPGDVAAVAPSTFELLAAHAALPESPSLLRPVCRGGHGHPLLIKREAYPAVLAYESAARGEAGSAGATTMAGGAGAPTAAGSAGAPTMAGSAGAPTAADGAGATTMAGGDGAPTVTGGAGAPAAPGGLKAALAGFVLGEIEVSDEGVLLDADTPADLERLRLYLS